MKAFSIEELQIIHDFQLFIREGFFYSFTDNLLNDFANYMDNLYYPIDRKYQNILLKISKNYQILYSLTNVDFINNNHLEQIKKYIDKYNKKYHLNKLSDEEKKQLNIALNDLRMGLNSNNLIHFSDLYQFAVYMQMFYKKVPYFKAADLLYSLSNNENKIDLDFYNKFFNSECINLKSTSCGHFMEVLNYTKGSNNKILVKK